MDEPYMEAGIDKFIWVLPDRYLDRPLWDDVLVEDTWWQGCIERFSKLPAYLIGIRCPLEVLEEREKSRRNRTLGQAHLQFDIVLGRGIYDLEVDTSILTAEECAKSIKERITSEEPPSALKILARI